MSWGASTRQAKFKIYVIKASKRKAYYFILLVLWYIMAENGFLQAVGFSAETVQKWEYEYIHDEDVW